MKYIENSKDYYIDKEGQIYRGNYALRMNPGRQYKAVEIRYLDGTTKTWYVHRLMATMYLENPEGKPLVNHIDSDKHNNRLENLEWATYSENINHAIQSGNVPIGEDHPFAILTEEQVHDICKALEQGERVVDLMKKFGVSQPTISYIKTGRNWKHVSRHYTFPPKSRTLSDETIRWICHMLEEGHRFKAINALNPNIKVGQVDAILHRLAFKDISKDFNF